MHAHFKIKHNSVYYIQESADTWEKYSEICHIQKIFIASVFRSDNTFLKVTTRLPFSFLSFALEQI